MLDFPNLVLSYHNFQDTWKYDGNFVWVDQSLSKVVKVSVIAHTEQDV